MSIKRMGNIDVNILRKGQILFCKKKITDYKFSETDIIKILEFFLNKDITDTAMSASYLDLQLDIDCEDQLRSKLRHNRGF